MPATLDDISDTTKTKTDQLNNVDLIAGPITVKILGIKLCGDEKQPIAVEITGNLPWKPCKNMRRILLAGWSEKAKSWVGKSVKLYRDPDVEYGKDVTGGIRIQAMSHIAKPFEISLQERRGKFKIYSIAKLDTQSDATTVEKYTKRINELTTQAELIAAHDKFGQACGNMTEQEKQTIEAAFASRLNEVTKGLPPTQRD